MDVQKGAKEVQNQECAQDEQGNVIQGYFESKIRLWWGSCLQKELKVIKKQEFYESQNSPEKPYKDLNLSAAIFWLPRFYVVLILPDCWFHCTHHKCHHHHTFTSSYENCFAGGIEKIPSGKISVELSKAWYMRLFLIF